MVQSILIVGAGIIGAATALQLARAGHRVRLIHNGQADATRAAFGWINASFYLDADHHRLRVAGIDAWRRLTGDVSMRVEWQGCLCWDMDETDLARTYDALQALDYPVEKLSRARVQQMEPALAECPEQALYFPQEGAAHSAEIARQLLAEG